MMKIAFLVSGGGDNYVLKSMHKINAWDISVIGYDINCTGLSYAIENNLKTVIINEGNTREELTTNIIEALNKVNPDVVVLLFHRLLGKSYFKSIKVPTINIHPSLLPSFSGFKAIDQAITHGVKVTGVTAHLVDESEDGGPIIIQAIQPISQKVTSYHDLLSDLNDLYISCTIQSLLWIEQDRIKNNNGITFIKDASFDNNNYYPNLENEVHLLKEKLTAS